MKIIIKKLGKGVESQKRSEYNKDVRSKIVKQQGSSNVNLEFYLKTLRSKKVKVKIKSRK
jgi:hypothetical protein